MSLHDAADGMGIRSEQQMPQFVSHDTGENCCQVNLRTRLEIPCSLPEYVAVLSGTVGRQISNPTSCVAGSTCAVRLNPQDEMQGPTDFIGSCGTTGVVRTSTSEPAHLE